MTLALCLLLLALSGQSPAPAASHVEQFTKLEQQWMDALAAKDEATLQRMLAREFSIIGAGSSADDLVGDRSSWLQLAMKRPFPKHTVSRVKVTLLDDVAVVQSVLEGDYPPKSLTAEGGRLQFLVTDVWVQREGRWQVLTRHASLPAPPVKR